MFPASPVPSRLGKENVSTPTKQHSPKRAGRRGAEGRRTDDSYRRTVSTAQDRRQQDARAAVTPIKGYPPGGAREQGPEGRDEEPSYQAPLAQRRDNAGDMPKHLQGEGQEDGKK